MDSAIKLMEEAQMRLGCGCGPELCTTCREVDSRIDALLATGGWLPVETPKFISGFDMMSAGQTVYCYGKDGKPYQFVLPPPPGEKL